MNDELSSILGQLQAALERVDSVQAARTLLADTEWLGGRSSSYSSFARATCPKIDLRRVWTERRLEVTRFRP